MKHLATQMKRFLWLMLPFAMLLIGLFLSMEPEGLQPLQIQGSTTLDGKDWAMDGGIIPSDSRVKHVFQATGKLSASVPQGYNMYFQLRNGRVEMQKNGAEFFSYDTKISANSGSPEFRTEWVLVHSPGLGPEDTVTITVRDATVASINILRSNLYAGDGLELLKTQAREHIWQIIISGILLATGLTYGLTLFALRKVQEDISPQYLSCAILLVSGAVCTFIDYDYITLLFSNSMMINVTDYLTQAIIFMSLLSYLITFLVRPWCRRLATSLLILMAAVVLLCCCNMLIGFSSANSYLTEQQFLLAAIIILITLGMLLWEYRETKNKPVQWLLMSSMVLAVATASEIAHFYITSVYWIEVFQVGLVFFALVQFRLLFENARARLLLAKETERKLADSRISVMLSQIQPHFLFNVLGTIAKLCDKDPVLAKQATLQFSEYLRGNMNSLTLDHPVPFDKELEHLRAYLSLEKIRFGDMLNIVYQIETTGFMLPALTVQPIVENAVKYGVGMAEDGGTVTISTKEQDGGIVILVSDDGVGFDPMQTQYDGRSHIGIDNVRSRLSAMVGGTLAIRSSPGAGTEVEIRIPKEAK